MAIVTPLTVGFVTVQGESSDTVNTVTLPIEVVGPDGHVEAVTVFVSRPADVDSLYLRAHALGYTYTPELEQTGDYDKKASFRINGGAWIPIDNEHFRAFYPESRMWASPLTGPIGGPYHTLRGMLDVSATGPLVEGQNVIEFRFNGTEGSSSGYRVLDFDFRASRGGESLIDGTVFAVENPATWEAPVGYGDAQSISEGKVLWQQRNVLTASSLNEATLVAACSDCHATSGRDLKYFNFSNKSIVERSMFHGLTEEEGKKIAAYIRSVDLDLPDDEDVGTCGGRPWNPPYQPGPGQLARPVECFAAGAGLEWVLEEDEQALPFILPDAQTRLLLEGLAEVPESYDAFLEQHALQSSFDWEEARHRISMDVSLPVADIPKAHHFPTIYEWWPDIYPGDYFGDAAFHASQSYLNLSQIHSSLQQPGKVDALVQATSDYKNHKFSRGFGNFFRTYSIEMNPKAWPDDLAPPAHDAVKSDWRTMTGRLSNKQWTAIKLWEIFTTYKMEDLVEDAYEPNGRDRDMAGWDRGWQGLNMGLYDVATHKQGAVYTSPGAYPTGTQGSYFSMAWYQLAQILHPGHRKTGGTTNIDWNYVFPHIRDGLEEGYGRAVLWEAFGSEIVKLQSRASWTTGYAEPGWGGYRKVGWRDNKNGIPAGMWEGGGGLYWSSNASEMRVRATELSLKAWIEESTFYSDSTWHTYESDFGRDAVFSYADNCDGYASHLDSNGNGIKFILNLVYRLDCTGMADSVLLDQVARWGEETFPGGEWEPFMLQGHPAAALHTIPLQQGWNLVSTWVQPDDTAFEAMLAPLSDNLLVAKDEDGNIYLPDTVNNIGSWGVADAYRMYMAASDTLFVQGVAVTGEQAAVTLEAGWNYVAYVSDEMRRPEDVFGPLGDKLGIVKDGSGDVYQPGDGVNTIGMLEPGQGYIVFMHEAGTIGYASDSGVSPTVVGPSPAHDELDRDHLVAPQEFDDTQ